MNQMFWLPDAQSDPINEGERVILDVFTLVQTQAYQRYLASVAREAAETVQAAYGGTVVENATLYRVDGEIGPITFPTHAVHQEEQIVWNSVRKVFGALGPRVFNRIRRSPRQNRTPVTTIGEIVPREGLVVQLYLDQWADATLAQHAFTPEGTPKTPNALDDRPLAEAQHQQTQ